ncbi:MAG: PilZ domain-containing protein [Candidatus Lernaella stagnicola]|nr:PilZ domain-containing protein [Candidatus Lernaella stagnicola]
MPQAVQRSEPRINFRLSVFFGESEPDLIGHVKNISLYGAAISCANLVTPKTRLNMRLETDRGPMKMVGEVRWSRRFSLQFSFVDDCEMGVHFVESDPRYPNYFSDLSEQHVELRAEPRFDKVFIVTIDNGTELQTLNISRSGMYVMTANSPACGSIVQVRLVLPNLNITVGIEGEVQHTVDVSEAYDRGLKPGFGLKFLRFLTETEAQFHEYVDWLAGAPIRDETPS